MLPAPQNRLILLKNAVVAMSPITPASPVLAQVSGASKNGVTTMAIRLGLHAKAVHDKRVCGLDITEAQLVEK